MKSLLKQILPTKIFMMIRDVFYPEKINILEERLNNLFITHYKDLTAPDLNQKIALKNAEFKVYSKHGGDGIIAHIFSKVGVTNRTFIEIGIEDGRECNTANLSRNFGWQGLMIDANEKWVNSARNFYKEHKVTVAHSFVTAENINETIAKAGLQGEIDVLSLDIDSNDYWIWKAIISVSPRVVVLEYNSTFGLKPVTVKYDPNFHYEKTYQENPLYFGASLTAMSKLSKEKGYVLVACDTHGHDAFFVREDVAQGIFFELSAQTAFYPNPFNLKRFGSIEEQFEHIKNLNFEEV